MDVRIGLAAVYVMCIRLSSVDLCFRIVSPYSRMRDVFRVSCMFVASS